MKHSTMVTTIHDSKTGQPSGHRAHCECGWKSPFTTSRELADSSARTHREIASRQAVAR
jgi:hypothetical protein